MAQGLVILNLLANCSFLKDDESKVISPKNQVQSNIQYQGKLLFEFADLPKGQVALAGDISVSLKDLGRDLQLNDLIQQKNLLWKKVQQGDAGKNNFQLGVLDTKIFHRKIKIIEDIIKKRALEQESKKNKMNLVEYYKKSIQTEEASRVSLEEIQTYMNEKNWKENPKNFERVREKLAHLKLMKNKKFILEKYILELPIKISKIEVPEPDYSLADTLNSVTLWGPKDSRFKVQVFSGFRSESERNLIQELAQLKNNYSGLAVEFLPLVSPTNTYQRAVAQLGVCLGQKGSDRFYEYFEFSTTLHSLSYEKTLQAFQESPYFSNNEVNICLEDQENTVLVSQISDFEKTMGMTSGPIVVVGGFVLWGAVKIQDIQNIINWKLRLPTAGLWN